MLSPYLLLEKKTSLGLKIKIFSQLYAIFALG